jgi:putative FmdB family regulatory protein
MPVYEYECGSCGGRFEAIRKFSDPELLECQLCKAANVRKVLSTPAFVLKGSGWYVTDYPSTDRKEGDASEKPKELPKPVGCSAGTCSGPCASKAEP